MKKVAIKNLFNAFIQCFIRLINKLSPRKRQSIIFGLAKAALNVAHNTRGRAINNIQKAMPFLAAQEAHDLAISSYQNIAYGVLETFWLNQLEIKVECNLSTSQLLNSGKGLVIATLHMSCYEVVPLAVQQLTGRSTTLSKIPEFFPDAKKLYENVGIQCIDKNGKNTLFELVKSAQNNRIVCVHADHYAKDLEINFFNQKTKAPSGIGLISSLAKVPVLIGYATRNNDGSYSVIFETIKNEPVDKNIHAIEQLMAKVYQSFERVILQYPEQWYWSYNRWR
ncbi:lysophospholipid acyltransferase family protein [Aliikangiella sp. IMCC44359]|uniref:lysophospholipid acyltransferase family protein n=1 Tax=Aliikangiella sp. IMCC44359 TaxID=3459125 RepID=UPI00403AC4B0